jgi:hypothetical protein
MKRIYYEGEDEDTAETCDVGTDLIPDLEPGEFGLECGEVATYRIEDPAGGPAWLVCAKHKDEAKRKGIAQ